jgi:putative selenium metabolism protein SsnA
MILTNARILTFDATNRVLDTGSVEIRADGAIGAVDTRRHRGADVVDAGGRLLMPALINCHSHLYSTLARGITLPGDPPADFAAILAKLWWRLDRALTADDIYYSAVIGLIDSAKCGVGTVIDHHSSPTACPGSLDIIELAFRKVGLRGATCYETSDRNGPESAAEGLCENVRFLAKRRYPLVGAAFGLHAAFTLGDRTLAACAEANQSIAAPFHIHLSEGPCDASAVRRLCKAGILNERTLAAHAIHLTATERALLARRGVNVIHNPQSNCNNAVGIADVVDLFRRGILAGLGSDGYSPRMWDEFKTAFHLQKVRASDARVGYREAYAALFLNNREIVRKLFGFRVGSIESGVAADLMLVDYFPPSPIDGGNLFGHLLFGVANAPVDSLIVNGQYVVREKRCVLADERRAAEKAAKCAQALWARM